MSCPLNNSTSEVDSGGTMLYEEYLMLEKILNAQRTLSGNDKGSVAHDEHLFIVLHQTYELWFKEIIYELDLVRQELIKVDVAHELNYSEVIKRLKRIVMILKLLVDQVLILETMTPMDFNAFRGYLNPASGFQSLQFRIIENKLGLRQEYRIIKFNQNYSKVFRKDENAINEIQKSLEEKSLLQLIEKWLEQTPHLELLWTHYKSAIDNLLATTDIDRNETRPSHKDDKNVNAMKKTSDQYETIFNMQMHEALVKRGERKLSFKALQAGIIISLYKDEPFYTTSHQILMLLIDLDSMLSKWRYNHVLMVQRMIGSMQIGTGGSSGYQYLRSTLSDRYKPFIDLSNMATYLIPKQLLQPLPQLLNKISKNCVWNSKTKHSKEPNETFDSFENFTKTHYTINSCSYCSYEKKDSDDMSNNELLINELQMQNSQQVNQMCNNGIVLSTCTLSTNETNLNVNSSEDEKKELESSFESTSSTSSSS